MCVCVCVCVWWWWCAPHPHPASPCAELVELSPSLRDIVLSLLDEGLEERQNEQDLGAFLGAGGDVIGLPVLVRALDVLLDAWGRLEGHLDKGEGERAGEGSLQTLLCSGVLGVGQVRVQV